ncbi:MAG: tetratricopeptide repeat protein [Desulfobacteraceae bacterium]|nr:tetratricopeptide repeat protein [Desulfobacteraceae bacterium]
MKKHKDCLRSEAAENGVDIRYSDIIDGIRTIPDVDPPMGMAHAVVQQLAAKKIPTWRRIRLALSRPWTFSIVPAKWAPVAVCALLILLVLPNHNPSTPSWSPAKAEAEFNYITGRRFLSENEPGKAISFLKNAASRMPDNPDYHFWVGVAHWALDDELNERKSYQIALDLKSDYLPAHVYLGHNYLDRGLLNEALSHYRQVLDQVPDHPEALFNVGLALKELGETEKERAAWKACLEANPSGSKSDQAVNNLYSLGDFSYQLFSIRSMRTAVKTIRFEDASSRMIPESRKTISAIGNLMEKHDDYILQVIVHSAGDEALAKHQAKAIKKQLITEFPSLDRRRIGISWFGQKKVYHVGGKQVEVASDVRLFAEPAHRSTRI